VAKRTVAFVDNHDDLPDSAYHVENLFEIAFGSTNPLRAKVLQLDRRQAALFREGFGDKRLAGAHRTGKQNPHRHATGASFANALRNDHQVFLHFFHAADNFESVRWFDKFNQSKTLALQDLALSFRD